VLESLRAFWEAVQAFGLRIAEVRWGLLAGAVGFSLANLALRSRAWQAILRAAMPGRPVRYRTAFGAYCAGVGVNAALPARAGDLVKVFLVKRAVAGAAYPTLVGTLVAETLLDLVISTGLLVWALYAGILPGLRLPDVPAFEISLALRHPWISVAVAAALVIAGLVAARRVRAFWHAFGQGLAILGTPGRYLRGVATHQALGWGCRVAAAACFLAAFHLPATLEGALIVQVAGGLGSLFPATPGGLGPKQALLVVMLAGSAGRTDVLAFSAGMELSLLVVNVLLGLACLALMLRNLRFRQAIADARADRDGTGSG
jgi:uncharacterized membrane protein YbhN (UPF0104 family)